MTMTMSAPGFRVTRAFEGCSLKAYRDEAGVWTIGYGATNNDAAVLGFTIKAGVVITQEQAEQLLPISMRRLYEPAVNSAMGPGQPNQAQFDAGSDFHFNTGAIKRASWVKSFVAHNLTDLHPQILAWNKAGGKVLAGLSRRRKREWEMINSGDYGPEGGGHTSLAPAPAPVPTYVPTGQPAWLDRMDSILGLYEHPGEGDNPAILAMAQQCGGSIARNYKHDSTPWCALTINWCLVTTGNKGDDSLLALDFRKATQRLTGPVVGAIATKQRTGGGHVFIVRGRTADGKIVGVGGNQSDMVRDEVFDPVADDIRFGWPKGVTLPAAVGLLTMPIVSPRAHTHIDFGSLPGSHAALGNGKPPADLQGTPGMLRQGDNGQEVIEAKGLLIKAGYTLDPANDKFGPKTDAALRDFQRRHPQLEVTGCFDPATRAALARDAAAKADLGGVAKATTATGGVTTAAHAATHGVPTAVFIVLGVVAIVACVLIAWKYRDEVRTMFRGKKA